MGLSTAERNKRKRERKKREKREQEEERKQEEEEEEALQKEKAASNGNDAHNNAAPENDDVEIEYVAEAVAPDVAEVLKEQGGNADRFLPQDNNNNEGASSSSSAVVTDDERGGFEKLTGMGGAADDDFERGNNDRDGAGGGATNNLSKRKLRDMIRPSVASLKRRVARPDLVEAHDVAATDPDFLLQLKAVPGSVPVPRHWGRKRKYLQGKRGFEKPPFQLPDFIVQTGITEIRQSVAEEEATMSAKQKNRSRVAPKMGSIDVDYRTLYDAFFKHQTKPTNLTKLGDLYFEGKELEVDLKGKKIGQLSAKLRDALGMMSETSPPPWLLSMQRYGPPPSYPALSIPGLNAPLPLPTCQYGFHPGGWGKPPIDAYGRPLYGGNPFDPPGSSSKKNDVGENLVTSHGKALTKASWGALPMADLHDDEEEEEEESSGDEMEDSEEEEGEEEEEETAGATMTDGVESVLPPPSNLMAATAPIDLRKQGTGDETPAPQKALYQVLEQTQASGQAGAVFGSEVAYVVPGGAATAATAEAGAESVLSKAVPAAEQAKRKQRKAEEEEESDLGKNFKF